MRGKEDNSGVKFGSGTIFFIIENKNQPKVRVSLGTWDNEVPEKCSIIRGLSDLLKRNFKEK